MAILDEVLTDFRADPRRVSLTGVGMGGLGVWSLAKFHPARFAAIVPVSCDGSPSWAASLKDVPCWAFHGDADQVAPVQETREMVRAFTWAGGRARYQEFRGVGHDCWERAYADPELFRWLKAQARP